MGWGGFGAGGASTDVGMSSAGDLGGEGGMTQAVPEQGSGATPGTFGKDMLEAYGKQKGSSGSGATNASKRPIGEHPEATDLSREPVRQGFARLSEIPERQRTYGTP